MAPRVTVVDIARKYFVFYSSSALRSSRLKKTGSFKSQKHSVIIIIIIHFKDAV